MSTPRPDLSQRRTKVDVKPAPDLNVDPIDLAPAPQPSPNAQAMIQSKPRKPVRITTDISPQAYRALTAFSAELAAQLGRPKIAHTEVVRALLAHLEDDPGLRITIAARVTENIRKSVNP